MQFAQLSAQKLKEMTKIEALEARIAGKKSRLESANEALRSDVSSLQHTNEVLTAKAMMVCTTPMYIFAVASFLSPHLFQLAGALSCHIIIFQTCLHLPNAFEN